MTEELIMNLAKEALLAFIAGNPLPAGVQDVETMGLNYRVVINNPARQNGTWEVYYMLNAIGPIDCWNE